MSSNCSYVHKLYSDMICALIYLSTLLFLQLITINIIISYVLWHYILIIDVLYAEMPATRELRETCLESCIAWVFPLPCSSSLYPQNLHIKVQLSLLLLLRHHSLSFLISCQVRVLTIYFNTTWTWQSQFNLQFKLLEMIFVSQISKKSIIIMIVYRIGLVSPELSL